MNRRGEYIEMKYLTDSRTTLLYDIPLAEVVTDFFDELKSRSKGYASMEYKITGVEVWQVWGVTAHKLATVGAKNRISRYVMAWSTRVVDDDVDRHLLPHVCYP